MEAYRVYSWGKSSDDVFSMNHILSIKSRKYGNFGGSSYWDLSD
jgi:hypothetical protein